MDFSLMPLMSLMNGSLDAEWMDQFAQPTK